MDVEHYIWPIRYFGIYGSALLRGDAGSAGAARIVADFDGVTDEAFEAVVAVMKKKYAKEHDDKKEEEKDAKAEIEEELDPAEASEDVLEEAEASEEVAISEVEPEVDPAESLRAAASEWIGSFLQSTPKNK